MGKPRHSCITCITCNNQGLSAKTTDGFSTVTVPIFVSPPVNAPSQGIEDARPAIAVKTSLKDVLAFFYCLSRFIQLALIFCQRLANSPKVEALQSPPFPPPRQGNVKKKFIKKGDTCANSGLAYVLSVCDMISLVKYPLSRRLQFFVYLAVFFTWVSCLTPKFGAHNRKMSLQKFPRMTKKRIKCVHLAILFQIYTGVLST